MPAIRRRPLLASLLSMTALLLLRPLRALAEWNTAAFSAATLDDALAATFGARTIAESDAIRIEMPELVENGAVVPIEVTTDLEAVASLSIFASLNPNPLIARFYLAPGCLPVIATRLKIAAPSHVMVVAETAGGLFSSMKFVEVVAGGCG